MLTGNSSRENNQYVDEALEMVKQFMNQNHIAVLSFTAVQHMAQKW